MSPTDIEEEYSRRLRAHPDARWGWSFMYTPEASLQCAKAMLVGLNPGGSQLDPPNEWDYTAGENAYVDESWLGLGPGQHPLQQQVALMFRAASLAPGEVFAANFVPFRSRSWLELPDRDGALAFSRNLWRGMLARSPARLYLSLGKQAGEEIAGLLKAKLVKRHPADWGSQTVDEYRCSDGRVVLAIPHLSRYRIFGSNRTAAARAVEAASHIAGLGRKTT